MMRIATYALPALLLSACAANNQALIYTPSDGAYEALRSCRVAYEQDHLPPDTGYHFMGGLLDDMQHNADLAGPEMDKAVAACMAGKGYSKTVN